MHIFLLHTFQERFRIWKTWKASSESWETRPRSRWLSSFERRSFKSYRWESYRFGTSRPGKLSSGGVVVGWGGSRLWGNCKERMRKMLLERRSRILDNWRYAMAEGYNSNYWYPFVPYDQKGLIKTSFRDNSAEHSLIAPGPKLS